MTDAEANKLAQRANHLYWDTSRAAGKLARELGVSRSKFYALIEPLRLEKRCEECAGTIVFSSRTDREAGRGRCIGCGAVLELPEEEAASATLEPEGSPSLPEDRPPALELRDVITAPENRDLWLSAAVGAVFGLIAGAWWRRR